MKTICQIGLMGLMVCLSAQARLGETDHQIYARYGAVQKRYDDDGTWWHASYLFKEYIIIVYFHENTSTAECVTPLEERKFSDSEREALMDNISGTTNWMMDAGDDKFEQTCWTNAGGFMAATVDRIGSPSLLVVGTRDFILKLGTQEEEKEKKKADGF